MAHRLILFSLILALVPAVLRAQIDSLSTNDSLAAAPSAVPTSTERVKVKFPWTVRSFDKTDIARFPFRGTENYLPLFPGVVFVNNEFHLRGSRSNEAGYFIDGIDVTNPMYGSNGVPLIPEAIEVLEVHTGPYSATMGSYNGGIVASRMRKGGEKLSIHVDIQSDKFRSPGKQFLNTTGRGYENVVGTIGGPLPWFDIRFFLAGQRTTYANRQAMFLEPFKYENLVDDGLWRSTNSGKALPGAVAFDRNWLPGNRSERSTFQGNGSVNLFGISFSAMGSYEETEFPVGSDWPQVLANYYNQSRNMVSRTKTKFGALRAAYSFGDLLSATISYSFYDRYSKTFDQIFKDNWLEYSDSVANSQYFNTSQWIDRYTGPDPYSTVLAFRFNATGAPNNGYSKSRQSQARWAIDLDSRPVRSLELKAGASIDAWTMRSFTVGNIANLLRYLDLPPYPSYPLLYDGVQSAVFANSYEKRVRYINRGSISSYGYTILGQESDGYKLAGSPDATLDPPYQPVFSSAYLEGTVQSEAAHIQVGIRYERYDPQFKSATLYSFGHYSVDYNVALGIIDESEIQSSSPVSLLLPRVTLRLNPTERTWVFAGYGLFAQMPSLDPLYMSSFSFSRIIAAEDRSPYDTRSGSLSSSQVKPERSRIYEFGIEHLLKGNLVVRATTYHKVLSNQLQVAGYNDPAGVRLFNQYRNDGNGSARGLELQCEVTNAEGISAVLSYAYSEARGITSNPRSNRVLFSDETYPPIPTTTRPFDYEQAHRAAALLHARTGEGHGLWLSGIEATAVFTVCTGHPYTRESNIRNLGSTTVWHIGVSAIMDPRFTEPLEAHNASATPLTTNFDLRLSKTFNLDVASVTLFLNILNVFNTKNILNVYPRTGTAGDDSWFASLFSEWARQHANYDAFYRDINLKNRWAYMGATGYDIYGTPRQVQFGVNVTLGDSQ